MLFFQIMSNLICLPHSSARVEQILSQLNEKHKLFTEMHLTTSCKTTPRLVKYWEVRSNTGKLNANIIDMSKDILYGVL